MPFKLPRMARKEGVERWVVDRYRGRDKVARIRDSGRIRKIRENSGEYGKL